MRADRARRDTERGRRDIKGSDPFRKGDRRAELLAIGRRLFASHAYDELSIDELAARAGVAKGLLYYYFGSKRGYYVAVVEAAAAELRPMSRTMAIAIVGGINELMHMAVEEQRAHELTDLTDAAVELICAVLTAPET